MINNDIINKFKSNKLLINCNVLCIIDLLNLFSGYNIKFNTGEIANKRSLSNSLFLHANVIFVMKNNHLLFNFK